MTAPAEPHAHLTHALTIQRFLNHTSDLNGAIRGLQNAMPGFTYDNYYQRAKQAALAMLSKGATAIRTHITLLTDLEPVAAMAMLDVRNDLKDLIDIQCAPLTFGLVDDQGNRNLPAMAYYEKVLAMGCDIIGSCPHLSPQSRATQEALISLAVDHGLPIDLHTDEELTLDMLRLEDLADWAINSSFNQGITASHCVSLSIQPESVVEPIAAKVAAAGIGIIVNPETNLYLQGRNMVTSVVRGIPPIKTLMQAGVTVAGGGDNYLDPFNACGGGDPLFTARLLVAASHITPMQALDAVTTSARKVMGLPSAQGITVGAPAELLAVQGTSVEQILNNPATRMVIHQGKIVSHTTSETVMTPVVESSLNT